MAITVTTKPASATKPASDAPRNSIAEWVVTFLILLFGTTTLAQAFIMPTSSMDNTLLTGDHLLVDKLAYAPPGAFSKHLCRIRKSKRGDIIVFRYPSLLQEDYVKRVIGVPGDHIKLVEQGGVSERQASDRAVRHPHLSATSIPIATIFPHGSPSTVRSAHADRAQQMLHENVVNGELVVPAGNYFAMGDNRDNSLDSRYWGFVPRENIIGKPLIIFWSYDAPTEDLQDYSMQPHVDLASTSSPRRAGTGLCKLVRGYPLH